MLEREDKMRVCLISLTYLTTQISNFCDTLAVLLLSRLSLTVLSIPLFFSTSGCLHEKKSSSQNVLVLFKNDKYSWLKTCTNETLLIVLLHASLTSREDRGFFLSETLYIRVFTKLFVQTKPSFFPVDLPMGIVILKDLQTEIWLVHNLVHSNICTLNSLNKK